jgi:hypothetical protein
LQRREKIKSAAAATPKLLDSCPVLRYRWRMTDETPDPRVEIAVLRSCLWMTARRLKDYHDAPHFEIEPADEDDMPGMEVIVPASLGEKAAEALEKAQAMLKGQGRRR